MAAQLASTVYVNDPETHQTVELAAGTCPEPELAALVTNPAAWVDGEVPSSSKPAKSDHSPAGGDQDDASQDTKAAHSAKKTAARKSAATSRSGGRDAADEGSSGN
ncbi:hypothetical protein D0Z67_29095 (plasmid) [Streptomyces seoulensis]|uniref:Uncharacterized protein n=1 Tax=Streptomyces seoulensis TaxID=73044 RepID=A0A4P6U302_STRSO|nr:hypothetical protein [Streptomyces seoulensis]QBJ94429.1 hypothetical protein D0Z67_29095 [Streptomyces seoulensis]